MTVTTESEIRQKEKDELQPAQFQRSSPHYRRRQHLDACNVFLQTSQQHNELMF